MATGTKKIILAGGGTAGHIEPALAVAVELQKLTRRCNVSLLALKLG